MKKLLLLIAAMVLSSCSKEPTPAAIEFAGGQDDLSLNFSSQSTSQTIVFSSNYDWTATPSDEWINVTPRSGQAGQECNIVVSLDANNTFDKRSGNIIINAQELNVVLAVSQEQNNAIILSTPTVNLPQSGGQFTVQLKANIDYEYEIKADWIKSVETRALTDHSLRFKAKENPSQEKRVGEIVIKGGGFSETVTVTQAQLNHLSLSTTEQHFGYTGGEFSVEVQHNVDYDVKISDNWITQIESRAVETSTLNFAVVENTTYERRTATITISGGGISETITIVQSESTNIPNNVLIYTTTDGKRISPYNTTVFGAKYVSNTYANGVGTITFDAPITSIGDKAFYECSTIKSITLPDSVTFIGDNAFARCTSLTSISIPNSVISIRQSAFFFCTSLTSVTIPDSVTEIGEYAFSICTSLTTVTIPDSVTEIGFGVFDSCHSLKKVCYSGDLSAWCKINFTNGTANPMYNGAKLYLNGVELTEATIPTDVTKIKRHTFCGCTSLTSVTIGNSVTSIESWAFENCTSLTSVTIPDSVTEIGDSAFENCSSLTSVTIGNSVTSIGGGAFENCTSLTSVTIPDSVTSIRNGAFRDCTSLTSVTIPNSVTSIGDGAFSNCTLLTSITIPDSVTEIGHGVFDSCKGELIINSTKVCSRSSWLYGAAFTKLTIGNSVTEIGPAFMNCTSLTSVTIGNSVTSIGNHAFENCTSLTSITIPDSVKVIGDETFDSCTSLTSVTIGDSVTSIGGYAFMGCTSLTSVTIPNSVTEIGNGAFYNCTGLSSVTIGNSVTEIGWSAFENCTSLKEVYLKPTTPPTVRNDTFYMNPSSRKIYVPRNSEDKYRAASGWKDYADDIVGYDF